MHIYKKRVICAMLALTFAFLVCFGLVKIFDNTSVDIDSPTFGEDSLARVPNLSGESVTSHSVDSLPHLISDPVMTSKPELYPRNKVIDVPFIGQDPDYPCGCEGVSTVMLMNYYGINIGVDEFFGGVLDMFPFTYSEYTGRYYGEDMDRYYVGDPTSNLGKGCYAPVIKTAIEKVCGDEYIGVVEQGFTVAELAEKYLKKMGKPILIWATVGMRDSFDGTTWWITRTGNTFTFPAYMHCLVLVGYDDDLNLYYFNDPYRNNGLVSYDKDLVEEKFVQLGSQALAMYERDDYSVSPAALDTNKTYAIRNAATGKYISAFNGGTADGTNAIQNVYTGVSSQLFNVFINENGSYSFIDTATGNALTVEQDGNVCFSAFDGSAAQCFDVGENKGFFHVFSTADNNSALTVCGNYNGSRGASSTSDGNVYMEKAVDLDSFYQLWQFVLVE